MSKYEDPANIPEYVEIIASGYEWWCPVCEELIQEIEYTEEVACTFCNRKYKTNPPEHAYE